MPYGRKRVRSRSVDFARASKTARRTGTVAMVSRARRSRSYRMISNKVTQRVNNLYRMIETKEGSNVTPSNFALPHNQITVCNRSGGSVLNPFQISQGAGDPMEANNGNRVGDQISVKGIMIKGFFENALARPKVFYRVMLLRGAKGETFDRTNIFKGDSGNKMIDQVNTERFSIVAQKVFTISASNVAASGVEAPNGSPLIATAGGVGTRTLKMWIPGYKFGRGGNVQFENASTTQVKFYDYRICILAYDWYGTPQDLNNVGRVNELYTKLYFKDA